MPFWKRPSLLPPHAARRRIRPALEMLEEREMLNGSATGWEIEHLLSQKDHAPDRILVQFQPGFKADIAPAMTFGEALDESQGWFVVHLHHGRTVAQALETYLHNPNVVFAQPDYLRF